MADIKKYDHRFEYSGPPSPERARKHEMIREECRIMARVMERNLPEGREKALAITKIEEAMFWANAAIDRNNSEGE